MITEVAPTVQPGFRWLETVDEAFEVMLAAIEKAERSIRLEVYIYRASPIGETFREALIRACQRGVAVSVLIDSLGSISLSDKFWEPLTEAGAKMRWFNPLKLQRLGFRNHRKSLVVDDKIGFVGGYNIAPEYQGDGVTKGWHDLGLMVPPSMAVELGKSFDRQFSLADSGPKRFARFRRAEVRYSVKTADGSLLFTGPGRGQNVLLNSIMADMARSQRIWLISAYFLPPRNLRRLLVRYARQGRDVRIILPGKSDVALSQYAARHLYHGFLRAGIKIYEYEPQILHTKMFLLDDVAYVGSANLDKRSLFINYELLARVEQREVAESATAVFESALQRSRHITIEEWDASRSLWSKFREQWSYLVLSKIDPFVTRLQLRLTRGRIPGGLNPTVVPAAPTPEPAAK